MIQLGNYNQLTVLRSTSVGIFLGDGEGTEILLPNKYVPEGIQVNDALDVFCYLDHAERPIATTLTPKVIRNGFAYLEVVEVNDIGAFFDWGLEKQLLVPFREQHTKLIAGHRYVVHCYLDEQSFRLVGSTKIDKFLKPTTTELNYNDAVSLLISRKTSLGWEVIIDQVYKGLLFFADVFQPLEPGMQLTGYVKKIREDGKIDVALQPQGVKLLDATATLIYEKLKANNGFLPLTDKSSPEHIKNELHISKKAFKKGVGTLYKQRKILLKEDGIRLIVS